MSQMPIGGLAKATGVKVPTIRFYEGIGLLPEPLRTQSDRRIYDETAVSRLAFIKHARQLGFSVDAIRNLLDLADHPDRPCEQANRLAAAQLQTVDAKIGQLEALRGELRRMVEAACDGRVSDCRVIEVLSDHALCEQDHAESPGT
ncbi:helix-turn-helix domain-containing protein [uncultured Phenylobacterium sp.]|uniref:MerR family transcriptional regulator n=1 Tax=uncultured Phenylobacterium sp. TaxID=349273 RepID=UPI0025F313DB|nr:helix-turn-helix domain-containing protein [uncultured Phenylobacterium sp.]